MTIGWEKVDKYPAPGNVQKKNMNSTSVTTRMALKVTASLFTCHFTATVHILYAYHECIVS